MDVNELSPNHIHCIQSFLSGKQAARSAVFCKAWYKAYLWRPALDFDINDFTDAIQFENFVFTSMERYVANKLLISRFSLRGDSGCEELINKALKIALKIGVQEVNVEGCFNRLPKEVFECKSLIKLRFKDGKIYDAPTTPSELISLILEKIDSTAKVMRRIIAACVVLEEVSLIKCYPFESEVFSFNTLKNLTALFFVEVALDREFFKFVSSELFCLKKLTVNKCEIPQRIEIGSKSLEVLIFETNTNCGITGKFELPKLWKFGYLGRMGLPRFSFQAVTKNWEFSFVVLTCRAFPHPEWFVALKDVIEHLSPSKVSLYVNMWRTACKNKTLSWPKEVGFTPVGVENVIIDVPPRYMPDFEQQMSLVCSAKILTIVGEKQMKSFITMEMASAVLRSKQGVGGTVRINEEEDGTIVIRDLADLVLLSLRL